MADTKLCTFNAEESEESEYSYEYVTDSEFEDESIEEDHESPEKDEMSLSNKESCVDGAKVNVNGDVAAMNKKSIEAMKPKLPAYISSPEPCQFSEDPGTWIEWMEDDVKG